MEYRQGTLKFLRTAYKTIILDVDGVVFDSNTVKEKNIYNATLAFTDEKVAEKFTKYFVSLNGVPREKKIFDFFENKEIALKILDEYNFLNENLKDVPFTEGAASFFQQFGEEINLFAISGGDQNEVQELFRQKNINHYFHKILGGPTNKNEHIVNISFPKPALFIGDSHIDYLAAQHGDVDFVFMYGYTQLNNWKQFTEEKTIPALKNFSELIHLSNS